MTSRTFTLEELEEFGAEPYEAVWRGESWDTRWDKHTEIVFEADGKFYKTDYVQGLTEYQERSGWECYPNATYDVEAPDYTLTCPEVESYQKQVTVTEWRPVASPA